MPLRLLGLGDLFPNGKEVMLSFVKYLSSLLLMMKSASRVEVRPINGIHKQCESTIKLYASLKMASLPIIALMQCCKLLTWGIKCVKKETMSHKFRCVGMIKNEFLMRSYVSKITIKIVLQMIRICFYFIFCGAVFPRRLWLHMADKENGDMKMRSCPSGWEAITSSSQAKSASYANDGPGAGRRAIKVFVKFWLTAICSQVLLS